MCLEDEVAVNDDFNISTPVATTVLELAQLIWHKIHGDKPFSYTSDTPFTYDVQKRVASTEKAKRILGYEATTTLSQALDEVIPWIEVEMKLGGI
jgi:nucleoside-diphosphate-sugar epimerase